MIEPSEFSSDDIFLLGNIAALAVRHGQGEQALPLLKLVQEARPENAGAFMLEAVYLHMIGECAQAIEFLENITIEQMKINRDETIAFHLFLLQQDGQQKRAAKLGHDYLNAGLIASEGVRESIRLIIAECEAAPISAAKHPDLGGKYAGQLFDLSR